MKNNKIQIQKLKASFSEELDSDGEKIILEISINNELKNLLKDVCLSDTTETRIFIGGRGDPDSYCISKRHKVKAIIYKELNNDFKGILFLEELQKTKKVKIQYHNINILENSKIGFKETLKRLVEIYGNITLKQDILFRIE